MATHDWFPHSRCRPSFSDEEIRHDDTSDDALSFLVRGSDGRFFATHLRKLERMNMNTPSDFLGQGFQTSESSEMSDNTSDEEIGACSHGIIGQLKTKRNKHF